MDSVSIYLGGFPQVGKEQTKGRLANTIHHSSGIWEIFAGEQSASICVTCTISIQLLVLVRLYAAIQPLIL